MERRWRVAAWWLGSVGRRSVRVRRLLVGVLRMLVGVLWLLVAVGRRLVGVWWLMVSVRRLLVGVRRMLVGVLWLLLAIRQRSGWQGRVRSRWRLHGGWSDLRLRIGRCASRWRSKGSGRVPLSRLSRAVVVVGHVVLWVHPHRPAGRQRAGGSGHESKLARLAVVLASAASEEPKVGGGISLTLGGVLSSFANIPLGLKLVETFSQRAGAPAVDCGPRDVPVRGEVPPSAMLSALAVVLVILVLLCLFAAIVLILKRTKLEPPARTYPLASSLPARASSQFEQPRPAATQGAYAMAAEASRVDELAAQRRREGKQPMGFSPRMLNPNPNPNPYPNPNPNPNPNQVLAAHAQPLHAQPLGSERDRGAA
eukprot:scaffold77662_cov47-Phaeocystis_antarctica.AAC.1